MDRRTFLKTSTVAAAASTTAAGSASAYADDVLGAPAIITSRHDWLLRHRACPRAADAALEVAREIEAVSSDRIRIHLVAEDGTDGALSSKDADVLFGLPADELAAPELALFSGLPGRLGLSPEHMLTWHTAAGGDMALNEAMTDHGFVGLIADHGGAGPGIWASRPVSDLREFAMARMTAGGLGSRVVADIQAAYAEPFASTNGAQAALLVEASAGPVEAMMGLSEETRRVWYRDSVHSSGVAGFLMMSHAAWERLAPSDQTLVRIVAHQAAGRAIARSRVGERTILPSLIKHGVIHSAVLPSDIALALEHTSRRVTLETLANATDIAPGLASYRYFYEAMLGVPFSAAPTSAVA